MSLGTAWAQTKSATATTLTVTSDGKPVTSETLGSVVTLTAAVSVNGAAVAPGQVNFCDASAQYCTDIHLLGMAQLTSAGTATLKVRQGIGSHRYKAVFLGTSSYSGSVSSAATLTVTGTTGTLASTTTIAESGSWGEYTLTGTVTETGGTASPTGSISFVDRSNANATLQTAALGLSVAGIAWPNPQALTLPTNSPQAAVVGDFNGDGIPDVGLSAGSPN